MSEQGAAERRELESAGWEPKGEGPKTIWRSPDDGRWYAHYQAVEVQRKGERGPEEELLLDERGFERGTPDGTPDGGERWVKRGEKPRRLYIRSKALKMARRGEL
ncbi:MAG: hypothetical protein H0U55_03045 [Rubrobacteraceae bacterium]|nr:hypothetical protein [Rubrobacteraceae bacterium]